MAKPTFKANPIQVQVPATSANLGPGFDCFGLALAMHDRYIAQVLDDPTLDIDVTGENSVVVEQVVTNYDPDEKIISDLYNAGKTEVTYEELCKAGFDKKRTAAYTFNIGEFTLSRFMLVSPYTIEKNNT